MEIFSNSDTHIFPTWILMYHIFKVPWHLISMNRSPAKKNSIENTERFFTWTRTKVRECQFENDHEMKKHRKK